ncbi:NADH-quinone oxidoreductase subunit L [Acetobacter senegalensis]|uniref:NADH-quinone oxidoreductase subunit L n=1 Tax=Acetobacter senegalensis TaxID=446692 RepID=UPI00209F5D0E|nr:NADH-quinone oxidoreductase subunit L [Acetobacter senegalensis]MCP1194767.1 NADH-quinone oxidoreductase subunit L [Acetobacter senegalensis]
MPYLLPLLVFFPLASAIFLFVTAGRLSARTVGWVATGAIGLSALCSIVLACFFLFSAVPAPIHIILWEWMHTQAFSADIAFILDPVSLVMILVVTIVGFLIHLYAIRYMEEEPGIARFFGSMTLFVASMLVLVLASDLFCLFIGWEGVGICSYLLIGFWYENPVNTAAARKAFYMTRIGDTAMLCGLLLLATTTGSLHIETLLATLHAGQIGPDVLTAATLFLLIGALAKSAQIPFQTWLPDAMAGPTPTSALIHAATMVTAGIYLIARLHELFAAAPLVMMLTSIIGALTLMMAACTALVQTDLKRILAWSTISQLGYMFLALGTGVWQAALFHLMTHAFFKALLFLTAGALIARLHHEQDIFRMGGLYRTMPGLTVAFLAGASALAGLPLVTSGFYSKEMILSSIWSAHFPLLAGSFPLAHILWGIALTGAFLTSLYIFRCIFIVFFNTPKTESTGSTPRLMAIPLACLSFLSLFGGVIEMPDTLAPIHLFTHFLSAPLPHADEPVWLLLAGASVPIAGMVIAWVLWGRATPVMQEIPGQATIIRVAKEGWGVDALYAFLFVQPFRFLVWLTRHDVLDYLITGIGRMVRAISSFLEHTRTRFLTLSSGRTTLLLQSGDTLLARVQNGRVRWYAAWIVAGLCAALASGVVP